MVRMSTGLGMGSVDLARLSHLAARISNVLRESTGPSREYQTLITEIDSISTTFYTLDLVVQEHPEPVSHRLQETLIKTLSTSHPLLESFMARIMGYQDALRRNSPGERWRDSWRKMGWAVFKPDDLVAMAEKLKGHTMTLERIAEDWNR
jgi:hypothetical protein